MIAGYPALAAHANRIELALTATLNGAVTWSAWHSEPAQGTMPAGRYRAGICWASDPIVIVAFRVHGQSDLISVYGLYSYLDETHRVRLGSPGVQPILDAIADAQAAEVKS
jgi:hypothetical protein